MIWLWRPRINFYRVFQRNYEEFYSFVFDDFEMNSTLQVTNVYPTVAALNLLLGRKEFMN